MRRPDKAAQKKSVKRHAYGQAPPATSSCRRTAIGGCRNSLVSGWKTGVFSPDFPYERKSAMRFNAIGALRQNGEDGIRQLTASLVRETRMEQGFLRRACFGRAE